MDRHIQDVMSENDFDRWVTFKALKEYGREWGYYSTQSGCSAVDLGTKITRLSDNNDDYGSYRGYSQFHVKKYQESLFYYLIYRDGFEKVDSNSSYTTHRFNADDNGGCDMMQYSLPKSEETVFRRKKDFALGHIQGKLRAINFDEIERFTIEKIEDISVTGKYYKFLVNDKHLMSVNTNQIDAFFQIVNKDFYAVHDHRNTTTYRRKSNPSHKPSETEDFSSSNTQ